MIRQIALPSRVQVICAEEAERYGVTVTMILSRSREHVIVDARNASMARIREEIGLSYPSIGRIFERDHSVVFDGIRNHKQGRRRIPSSPVRWRELALQQAATITRQSQVIEQLTKRMESAP